MNKKTRILEVQHVSVSFFQYMSGLRQKWITPIKDLNITLFSGEVHALIGASGSGKSLLAHAILGILPYNARCTGTIQYNGELLTEKKKKLLRGKEIAFIPQSVNFLDPLMKAGKQVRIGLPKQEAAAIEDALFKKYDLLPEVKNKYPHELSGGMLRRILFATSVRAGIRLIVADEPTPGIHPEALSAVLNQLRSFADEDAAVLLITHDIISALSIADRVTVLKDGESVDSVTAEAFSGAGEKLIHPYTKALWNSLPSNQFIHYAETEQWR